MRCGESAASWGRPCDSQRPCAAVALVRLSRSCSLIMSKASRLDASFGTAAAITIAYAYSGSVCHGTTSKTILVLSRPVTSMVLNGWRWTPSSSTGRAPVMSQAGVSIHSARFYITRSIGPSRTESTASRSGSSVERSSLRGHHAPSTYPVVGALGFKRRRGVRTRGMANSLRLLRACSSVIATIVGCQEQGTSSAPVLP